jgi:beta-fructofuranosidase
MYAPPAGIGPELGDVEVFPHGDEIHLFHLTLPNHDVVQHVVSTDGLAWRALPSAIRTSDPGEGPDDDMIYTMSVTEHDGAFYMVYTALGRAEAGRIQRVAVATSNDLIRWTKHTANPVAEADPRWYEATPLERGRVSWRDPKPIKVGDTFYAVICGRENVGPFLRRGCAGLLKSKDLLEWEVLPPLFAPRRYWDLECPQVFTVDGHYYLTAALMEDRGQHYWQAPTFDGPYTTPADGGVLAPMGHYAGRVCRWKDMDLFYCWHRPILIQGQFADYDWPATGTRMNSYGRIAPPPLALRRRPDGSLATYSFPGWDGYRGSSESPRPRRTSLFREQPVSGWRIDSTVGADLIVTDDELGDFMLEGELVLDAPSGGLGLRLDDRGGGYFVEFTPGRHECSLQKWLPPVDQPTYSYQEIQRGRLYRPLDAGQAVPFRLLSVENYIEVEIGGEVVLATLSGARISGLAGLWADDGTAQIANARLTTMNRPVNRL